MAELTNKLDITVEELEENLGSKKLPAFIKKSEELFLERTNTVVDAVCSNSGIKAVFISGPTSSGKTTFTKHLAEGLSKAGRKAEFLSLDDYYNLSELRFDKDGRPDFETIDTLDLERAQSDIRRIMNKEKVYTPYFDFISKSTFEKDEPIQLDENGVLVVEGLHGLNKRVSGSFKDDECIKIFIMPYGNVYCDTKLMETNEIRLIRRIIRDVRHRNATALATIDYWPMIERSEEAYYEDYLSCADYHVNSFLAYESLVVAPLALADIRAALAAVKDKTIAPSCFMEKSNTGKPYADLSKALDKARRLVEHLEKIPECDSARVPSDSILLEFIGEHK